jgi:hypothetical protein
VQDESAASISPATDLQDAAVELGVGPVVGSPHPAKRRAIPPVSSLWRFEIDLLPRLNGCILRIFKSHSGRVRGT